eukprot:CAMPEP_0172496870 /NCGR_PEP_ID=MMETSP1066-20121228/94363_1 /TAXON_ID=671091 /ORGANISM="Coscinodiscus wailesii, Strain CCMP2513" /LENGTH=44 /DNA_ID= /DNA_START= /DNA_END= /DNA_ORIENTATION=
MSDEESVKLKALMACFTIESVYEFWFTLGDKETGVMHKVRITAW